MKKLLLTGASLMLLATASLAAGNHNECVNYVNNFNLPNSGEQACPGSDYVSRQTDRSDNFAKAFPKPVKVVVTPPPPPPPPPPPHDDEGDDDGDQTASW